MRQRRRVPMVAAIPVAIRSSTLRQRAPSTKKPIMRLATLALTACAAALLAPSLAQAQPSGLLITVGANPWGVAIDTSNQTAYVTNYSSDTVSVIKESACAPAAPACTGTVTATIPVGRDPEGVAVDPYTDMIYVTNFGSGSVSVINGAKNTVIATIGGVGLNPNSVAVWDATNTVYVGSYMSSVVDVIGGATNTTTPCHSACAVAYQVPVANANIHDVVVNQSNGDVFVSAYNQNEVYFITSATVNAASSYGFGYETNAFCGPAGLAIDSTSTYGTLWIADNYPCGGNPPYGVFAFDTIGLSGAQSFAGSAAAPAYLTVLPGGDVFASVPSTNSVDEISGSSIVQTVTVGANPMMLDVDPNTDNVIVANHGSHTVSLIHF